MTRWCVLLAMTASLTTASPAAATVLYEVIDLGTLDGTTCSGTLGRSSVATALNGRGQVAGSSCAFVGFFSPVMHGFLWSVGVMRDLGALVNDPQPHQSVANGMNDAGQVVGVDGVSLLSGGNAFLWSGGTMTSLEPVLGGFSSAFDINNAGQIVGIRGSFPDIASFGAFQYDTGSGQLTPLPGFGTTFRIQASAINDAGVIAGYASSATNPNAFHAVRWIDHVPTDLGTVGGTHSFGFAINATGDVVGHSWTTGDSGEHAFLYSGGMMLDIGTLGGAFSHAFGISDAGLVVGSAATAAGASHAFVYEAGVMTDLNDLIPPGSGWVLDEATAINASGEIAGRGRVGGEQHAFLLTPGQSFFTLTPCRLVDTRNPDGPLAGPALAAAADRTFVLTGHCGIPSGARAISVNLTVTGPADAGNLRAFPGGGAAPVASSINYSAGQTRGNNAIVRLGPDGSVTVRCAQAAGTVHLVLDVNGYFAIAP